MRRLGDLAFLLGLYELAYTSYHTAKKDFEADQAWLHHAGALEMAALSAFLQSSTSTTSSNGEQLVLVLSDVSRTWRRP